MVLPEIEKFGFSFSQIRKSLGLRVDGVVKISLRRIASFS